MARWIGIGSVALVVFAGCIAACGSDPELGRLKPAAPQKSDKPKASVPEKAEAKEEAETPLETAPLCAEQTASYEPQRPKSNILFALDRSGSMHIRLPNGGTRWTATRDALFSLVDSLQQSSTRMSVMQFPQGDATVNSCCRIDAANEVVCDCASYPAPTKRCNPATYTASSPMVLDASGIASIKNTVNASNAEFYWGTPLAAAETAAVNLQKASPNDGVKSIILLTDGAPTSCETSATDPANDPRYVIDAAKAGLAAKEQIRTFVIGVVDGNTGARPDILSQVAEAGGTARSTECAANNTCFYSVSAGQLQKELGEALARIAREATDCTFDLPAAEATSDPEKVNVTVTGKSGTATVARDQAQKQGWDYVQNGNTRIKLFGDSCKQVQSDDGVKVNVVFGCKTVETP